MSEYCEYCKRTTAALAAANARVAELEAASEAERITRSKLCEKINERDRRITKLEGNLDATRTALECGKFNTWQTLETQLTALREAVAGVIACADMPTADNKEEVIKNFHAFIAAIERLRREVGG